MKWLSTDGCGKVPLDMKGVNFFEGVGSNGYSDMEVNGYQQKCRIALLVEEESKEVNRRSG